MSKVWIVCRNYGREGYDKPLAAFSTPELALIYQAGANDGGYGRVEITELTLDSVAKE